MSLVTTTRDELLARKGDWPAISRQTSLSYWWLIKFAQGRIANPGVSHIEALQSHFAKHPRNPTEEPHPA